VYAAYKRLSTTAGGEFKFLGWYLRVSKSGARRLIYRLVELTQFWVSFFALLSQNGSFQTPQSCHFLNRSLFPSFLMVMNLLSWLKIYYLECKQQKWDFCEKSTVWNFATKSVGVNFDVPVSWMSSYFSETRDPSYIGSAMCPECPTNDWRGKVCWLNPWESGWELVQGPGGMSTFTSLLGYILVWSQQIYLRLLLTVRCFAYSWGCCHPNQRKCGHESEWMNKVYNANIWRNCLKKTTKVMTTYN